MSGPLDQYLVSSKTLYGSSTTSLSPVSSSVSSVFSSVSSLVLSSSGLSASNDGAHRVTTVVSGPVAPSVWSTATTTSIKAVANGHYDKKDIALAVGLSLGIPAVSVTGSMIAWAQNSSWYEKAKSLPDSELSWPEDEYLLSSTGHT